MIVFFPLRSDAPMHYRPWATAGLILANIGVALVVGCTEPFFGFLKPSDYELINSLILQHDELRPLTWLTSCFVHANLLHLCGNMLFLAAFGRVVEGTAGSARTLALYLGIGTAQCALEQLLFWGGPGGSLGASGAIYGLIAVAAAWAPRCHMTVFYWVWRYVDTREFTILQVAAWWIGWELVYSVAAGFVLSSFVLHSLGAGVGLVVGIAMLKLAWVDAEGEDLLTLWGR